MKNIFKKALVLTSLGVSGTLALASCGSNDLKIAVPADGTNQCRALKLLETAGLIEIDPSAGFTPELKDITKYNYNIKIVPQSADTLASTLDDYAAACINGTYATSAGLVPSKDGLLIEQQSEDGSNPYVNIIAARSADKDNVTYKKIVEAYQTQIVAEYMLGKYEEAYYPAFSYEAKTSSEYSSTVSFIDTYDNSNVQYSKTVTVGVCGAKNDYWKAVQYVLDTQNAGIKIKTQTFSAFNIPNSALASGDIDLNAFQHKAYLANEVAANNYAIESIGDTLIAPLTVYSKNYSSLDALKEAAGLKK